MLKHLALAITLVAPLPAFSQEATATDDKMMSDGGPAAMAFMEANTRMHKMMMVDYTGNTDVDFVRGMIPHHQGAVEMAQIVLKYGQDPEVRKLAEGIIAAQESEIKWMQDWLAKNGS